VAVARNGDIELYYECIGDPEHPTLLMVNGLGSQCTNFRLEWCERFAARGLRIVRFDNRDAGLSTRMTTSYSLDEMATDAFAVLDAAGVDRAHVMGVSMGGMVAQLMAVQQPARLRSLTSVMSSTSEPGFGEISAAANALFDAPTPTTRAGYIEAFLDTERVVGSPGCFDEPWLRLVAGELFDRSYRPDGTARQLDAIRSAPSRDDVLRFVTVPTLVVHGDHDQLIDISGGRHTAEIIPGARFEVIPGMGHDYPPQYWDRFVELVAGHAHSADAR
jgi:pimeloyl-ACP methyl ester carboxylesterase